MEKKIYKAEVNVHSGNLNRSLTRHFIKLFSNSQVSYAGKDFARSRYKILAIHMTTSLKSSLFVILTVFFGFFYK